MKRFEPYEQGDLDSLCGVHAIINAVNANGPPLPSRASSKLFKVLLKRLAKERGKPMKVLWKGMDVRLLKRLLDHAVSHLKTQSVTCTSKRLSLSRAIGLEEALSVMQNRLASGWTPIISLQGKTAHWTVVRGVSKTRLHLCDSSGRKFVNIRDCTLDKKAGKHRLLADPILLIRRQRAERNARASVRQKRA